MKPFLFEIFGFNIYSYGMAMVTAFSICLLLTLKHLPKDLLSVQDIANFCLITMASLLFGTKLMGLVVHVNFNISAFLNALKFWQRGSFSFFPAFLLAVSLIFIYCKVKKISLLKTMDYLLPFAILGTAIQRCFGCFLGGCCYGKPTDLPWGVVFPGVCRAGKHFPGTPIHPTQLYYGITAFMIFAFLILYKKRPRPVGEITALGFILLASSYFIITFLRGDIPDEQFYFYLSRSQYLSLVIVVSGLLILLMIRYRRKRSKKETAGGNLYETRFLQRTQRFHRLCFFMPKEKEDT